VENSSFAKNIVPLAMFGMEVIMKRMWLLLLVLVAAPTAFADRTTLFVDTPIGSTATGNAYLVHIPGDRRSQFLDSVPGFIYAASGGQELFGEVVQDHCKGAQG
jgi:hypothetical protein